MFRLEVVRHFMAADIFPAMPTPDSLPPVRHPLESPSQPIFYRSPIPSSQLRVKCSDFFCRRNGLSTSPLHTNTLLSRLFAQAVYPQGIGDCTVLIIGQLW